MMMPPTMERASISLTKCPRENTYMPFLAVSAPRARAARRAFERKKSACRHRDTEHDHADDFTISRLSAAAPSKHHFRYFQAVSRAFARISLLLRRNFTSGIELRRYTLLRIFISAASSGAQPISRTALARRARVPLSFSATGSSFTAAA